MATRNLNLRNDNQTPGTDKKNVSITGTSGETYDLDEIVADSRLNEGKRLRVQVHEFADGEPENPDNIEIGSIWLSVKKKV